MRCRIGLLIVVASLAGCQPPVVKPPKVVQTTVKQIVPVPDELTKPCPIAMPQANTVAEAVRIARERRDALVKCNSRLQEIRALGQ